MDTNRIPKQAPQYKPKGRRNIGRPKKNGGTNFILRIKEQETRLIFHEHDDDDNDDNDDDDSDNDKAMFHMLNFTSFLLKSNFLT
jgi:hypothetical protein